MPRTATSRAEDSVYGEVGKAAVGNERSLSRLIETASLARVTEAQFASGGKAAQMLGNESLPGRPGQIRSKFDGTKALSRVTQAPVPTGTSVP